MILSFLHTLWGMSYLPSYLHAFDFWNYLWGLDGDCWKC